MEKPYQGRAIVEDNPDYLKITIPAKRNYISIVWICMWMLFWGYIGSTAVTELFISKGDSNHGFLIFWLSTWALGLVTVVKTIIWLFWGSEIIEIGLGTFSISRKNDLFTREKVYDLTECKNFRVRDRNSDTDRKYWFIFYYRNEDKGEMAFDYGMKTINFGEELYEAEAQHLLDTMKNKKLLTESQSF